MNHIEPLHSLGLRDAHDKTSLGSYLLHLAASCLVLRPNDVVESLHTGLAGLQSGVEAIQLKDSADHCSAKDACGGAGTF
jgi:hypothetical protein